MRLVALIVLGSLMGAVFERYRLCMSSTVTDQLLLGDGSKLRGLLFAVLLSAVTFNALIGLGGWKPAVEPLSAMTLPAGVVFGVGMVLAGGCVSGTLFKMGQGYAASLLAFVGLLLGFGAMGLVVPFMTRPWEEHQAAPWTHMTLPEILGVSPLLVTALAAVACLALARRWRRSQAIDLSGYSPLLGFTVVAILNSVYFALIRQPLGVGGTPVYATSGISYLIADRWTLGNPMLGVVLRYPAIALPGLSFLAGAALSALAARRLQVRGLALRQGASSLAGGFLMGLGTTLMVGCNVTHVLGGLPQLALSSLAATAGMVGGAWLGVAVLGRISVPRVALEPRDGVVATFAPTEESEPPRHRLADLIPLAAVIAGGCEPCAEKMVRRAVENGTPRRLISRTLRILTDLRSRGCFADAAGAEVAQRMQQPLAAATRVLAEVAGKTGGDGCCG